MQEMLLNTRTQHGLGDETGTLELGKIFPAGILQVPGAARGTGHSAPSPVATMATRVGERRCRR